MVKVIDASSIPAVTQVDGVRNNNQILHGDQTGWKENVYVVDYASCICQKLCDAKADARFVCGS